LRPKHKLATVILFAVLAAIFFTQDPTEARRRPWRGPHVTEDGWYYYHWLRSLAFDRDLDLANDYRAFGNWYGFGVTATGRPHNPFGVGPALFFAPGFAVGHVIARASGERPDGYTRAEQAGALSMSLLAAAGAFLFTFAFCRRYVSELAAWLATAIAFLGSPLVWYALYSPAMPHAFEAFFGSAFLWIALPFRARTQREAALYGLVCGGMLLARPQLAVFLVVPVLEAVVRRNGRTLATILLLALLVFSPQLYAWKVTYGRFLVVPQGSGFMRFSESLWTETLFSSRNGLFTVTPLLWFVLPGLLLVKKHHRSLAFALGAALLLQALINGAAWDWWGGGAFGGRRFAVTFPIWAFAFAIIGTRLATKRVPLAIMAASVCSLLFLQWRMVSAHRVHAVAWDAPVSFDQRLRAATGVRWIGRDAIGSPFAFPASALFALRHGVPLARYDLAVGPYLLDERLPTTNPLMPPKRRETVVFSSERAVAFLGRGFVQTARGAELAGPAGELLVPLNRTGRLRIELDATPGGAWSFNGTPSLDVAAVRRGINVLRVESESSVVVRSMTLVEGEDWPPAWATNPQGTP